MFMSLQILERLERFKFDVNVEISTTNDILTSKCKKGKERSIFD